MTTNNLHSDLEGGTAWTTGRFGQALSLDGNNDFVSIESKGKLNELHRSSYSISLWINPSVASSGLYNSGQLRIHGYQVAERSYFQICHLLNLPFSGSSLNRWSKAWILKMMLILQESVGVNNDNYLVLFSGAFKQRFQ